MRAVSGCQALVLEANHDVDMVRRGPYPQRLKQRILGQRGHLNNGTAPARCASWRKAERAPSFFLTFLLTIIYLNWHIIRYAARFRRRASTWETISASAFPGGTGFPTC